MFGVRRQNSLLYAFVHDYEKLSCLIPLIVVMKKIKPKMGGK